ncbi:hypothetical protein HNY73_012309 [Argiope bruennichi]|uniref:Uncharacterized protein n=1 Tax=Argiope bruennichi TaxID=94029 RepID=A0A8T0EW44_ARGBR|nr:hypothetical protein HNY73_012309 [Argiope bruennichi]
MFSSIHSRQPPQCSQAAIVPSARVNKPPCQSPPPVYPWMKDVGHPSWRAFVPTAVPKRNVRFISGRSGRVADGPGEKRNYLVRGNYSKRRHPLTSAGLWTCPDTMVTETGSRREKWCFY